MLNSRLYSPLLWCPSSYRSLSQGSTNSNMLDVQGGAHKKRARRSSLLNAKKLYEDAQMARKVKQYLSSLDVETDEEKFQMMSLQCEPAYSTCEYRFSLMTLNKIAQQNKFISLELCWSPKKINFHSQKINDITRASCDPANQILNPIHSWWYPMQEIEE